VPLMPAARIRTTVPKQGEGTESLTRIWALPSVVNVTGSVVAATASAHTTLASTCVTGPALPVLGRIRPRLYAQSAIVIQYHHAVTYHPGRTAACDKGVRYAGIRTNDRREKAKLLGLRTDREHRSQQTSQNNC
jgi:hypothetical protein